MLVEPAKLNAIMGRSIPVLGGCANGWVDCTIGGGGWAMEILYVIVSDRHSEDVSHLQPIVFWHFE